MGRNTPLIPIQENRMPVTLSSSSLCSFREIIVSTRERVDDVDDDNVVQ